MKTENKSVGLIDRIRSYNLGKRFKQVFLKRGMTFVHNASFVGWGMTTTSKTPWTQVGSGYELTSNFSKANAEMKKMVEERSFILSQFDNEDVENLSVKVLDTLTWRHYIVYWSAIHAVRNTKTQHKTLVECGVCDGLTIFFAMRAAQSLNASFSAYLYDAWEAMRNHDLKEKEKYVVGQYGYLDINNTKNNLKIFNEEIVFNKGFIPEVFETGKNPESVVWLHVDLNAAIPSIQSLNQFWDKLADGGVILFDDYACAIEQQTMIQEWASAKNGSILHLPTGQAIFFRN